MSPGRRLTVVGGEEGASVSASCASKVTVEEAAEATEVAIEEVSEMGCASYSIQSFSLAGVTTILGGLDGGGMRYGPFEYFELALESSDFPNTQAASFAVGSFSLTLKVPIRRLKMY